MKWNDDISGCVYLYVKLPTTFKEWSKLYVHFLFQSLHINWLLKYSLISLLKWLKTVWHYVKLARIWIHNLTDSTGWNYDECGTWMYIGSMVTHSCYITSYLIIILDTSLKVWHNKCFTLYWKSRRENLWLWERFF